MNLLNMFGDLNSAILTGAAGLLMGFFLKVATKWADRKKDNLTEHLELRKELREELDTVKEELRQLQKDVDEWREKYYAQVEINAVLQSEISALRMELNDYRGSTGEFNTQE
jgi:uncharacterized coiled-coil DUF342 family protein